MEKYISSMIKHTTEDLILYLYCETNEEETKSIEDALQSDWILKEKYDSLKEAYQNLNSLVRSPRQQSVNAILNYAKSNAEVVQP